MDTDIAPADRPPPLRPTLPAPRGWEAFGVLVLYFLLQAAVSFLLGCVIGLYAMWQQRAQGLPAAWAFAKTLLAEPRVGAWLVIASLIGAGAATAWLIRRRWPARWHEAMPPGLGLARPRRALDYPLAVLCGLALPVLGGLLTQWLARGHAVPQDIKQLGEAVSLLQRVLLTGVAVIVAPFIEELLFRGMLLSAWMRRLGAAPAVIATGALFALIHLPDLKFLWYGLPNLALLGLAFGWLRLKSRSLWPAVMAHGVNNLVSTAAWFFAAG